MHPRQHLPAAALALGRRQAGILTRKNLLEVGLTPQVIRRLSDGWHPLGRGLYCLTPPTWDSAVWAGLVKAGATGAVGGLAAARLHGWTHEEPDGITIWHGRRMEPLAVGKWTVTFRQGHRRGRGEASRTSPEETLLDGACETSADGIIHLLARAFAKGHTTPHRVLAQMEERTRQAHRRTIREACQQGMAGIESVLEWRFLTAVEQAHGLPVGVRQVWTSADGRVDVMHGEFGLIIELDGRIFHAEGKRDRRRDNRNVLRHNAKTLRYGWDEVLNDPCGVAAEIAAFLHAHGWNGDIRPCKRCRPDR